MKSKLCSNSLLRFAEKLCLSFLKCLQDLTGKSFWSANPNFRFLVKLSLATPVLGFVRYFAQLDCCSLKETEVLAEGFGRPVRAHPGAERGHRTTPRSCTPGQPGQAAPFSWAPGGPYCSALPGLAGFPPSPRSRDARVVTEGAPIPAGTAGWRGVRTGRARVCSEAVCLLVGAEPLWGLSQKSRYISTYVHVRAMKTI